MGFFATAWLWIKRLLVIALMAGCVAFSVLFIGDSAANKTALTVFLAILGIVLSLGNIVLYFMFDLGARFIVILGLVAHLILEIVVFALTENEFIVGSVCSVAVCLILVSRVIVLINSVSTRDIDKLGRILTGRD